MKVVCKAMIKHLRTVKHFLSHDIFVDFSLILIIKKT